MWLKPFHDVALNPLDKSNGNALQTTATDYW
jgi:hypothetical protein